MPGAGNNPLLMPDSRETKIFAALVTNNTSVPGRIAPITLTLGAAFTATTTGTASTMTASAAPTVPIIAGTVLRFVDAAGSYMAIVTSDSNDGSNIELTANENIPNSAVANWPGEVDLITSHNLGVQTTLNNVSTYQHIGSGESSRQDTTRTFTIAANLSEYSSGQRILRYAVNAENDVYLEVQDPNPDAVTFNTPPLSFGVARMSDGSKDGQNGNKLALSLNGTFSGAVTELEAAA